MVKPVSAPGSMTKIGAATAILDGIGAPVNHNTVGAMVGWMNAEGGNWNNSAAHNPLNTTLNMPGAQSINSVGVKSYNNWNQGINATVQTLKQSNMSGIVDAFRSGNAQNVVHAIATSPWGTSGQLVAQTIGAAMGQKFSVPSTKGIAQQMAGGGKVRGTGTTLPAVTGTNWGDDIANAMLTESATPVDENGNVRTENPLSLAMADAGQYTTTTPAQKVNLGASNGNAAIARMSAKGGDVNPIVHFQLGRTDMGVDASAKPGTPIAALNTSRVVGIIPNWYNGQPYVALRLLAGPNAGKTWYIAEQITGIPHVGQVFQRGQTVATYAPSGTGIEIGWADPTDWQKTLAQGTTGYSEGQQTAAGKSFRNLL